MRKLRDDEFIFIVQDATDSSFDAGYKIDLHPSGALLLTFHNGSSYLYPPGGWRNARRWPVSRCRADAIFRSHADAIEVPDLHSDEGRCDDCKTINGYGHTPGCSRA